MVKRCVWGTCNSDDRYKHKPHMSGVEFFPIPKPKTRLEETLQWVKACGRKDYAVSNVNKHAYVCSKHFVDGRPTTQHPYPIMATPLKQTVHKSRKLPFDRATVHIKASITTPTTSKIVDQVWMDVGAYVTLNGSNTSKDQPLQATPHFCEELKVDADHTYYAVKRGFNVQTTSISTQTDITMAEMDSLTDNMMDTGSMKRKNLMNDIMKDNKSCKFYTGVSLAVFCFILNFLRKKASSMVYWNSADTSERENSETPRKGPRRILDIKEELALTLLRLRRGFDTKTLGDMFAISESSVCRIFTTWLNLMYHDLKFLVRWPSREQVLKKMPKCFKHFKKTKCIIDCTEFFVQKPSLPSAQRITYSSYKHHNTFKCLVGITPRGSFSFISDLFTGSISDRKIVQDSGFLQKVEYGDDIMADRGFLIRGDLALKGATLNIPPFSMGKQMCANATTKTRRIARARIHVERAIGRLKNFTLLQRTIPLRMKHTFNQVVKVCAILCNLDSQLVK
ncbi:unnamed protein product [Mytilus edulis]|uniref:THAP-type domain-containing protein n=2 Tax=Mytilus TaxID=6548 RepID=A0A8B6E3M2_MYTGA|nr:unnamed protein product [Mytilus edulis]VDI27669.1 Hypothetical predicted protein [Mytilus galloprovincialis]